MPAGLLQRASFALPVADAETIHVTYPDALALMRELRGMGEGNALIAAARGRPAGASISARTAALYAERFGAEDGRISATFQAVFLTGWAPSRQPAATGTARQRRNQPGERVCREGLQLRG